ncbi:MerR family transcriptional regulator [Variovorax sp. J31P207]|uniref:MerR family transcriptional regulator n=1 Tax=Variovorax sp. J31P207 TaxID=3053510 RepID=UPI0025756C94|nr:MerR family transcriptional regulator [Variovorax sp. J31P207]MDM0066868.1 MerR family transcriptional regulator [Variovorax sp. J31P207]
MLISDFSKAAGLPVDTIRFYITKGLLRPKRGLKGGSNPYQVFSDGDLTAARMVRLQQSLGYSLAEIAALNKQYRAGARSPERTATVLRRQIDKLEEKEAGLDAALAFLRGKLAWVEAGQPGDGPAFNYYLC